MRRLLLLIAIATAPAWAGLVTITDTLKTPMGGTFFGRVVIALAGTTAQPLYNSAGDTLTGWETSVTVTSGAFSIQLEANDTITPAGTSYRVRMIPSNGSRETLENWVVTTSGSPVTVASLRRTTVPTPTVTLTASQFVMSAGSLLYGASNGYGAALGPGTNGHVLTLSGGYPTWAASTGGVTSITGTANQITASASTGAVTLSLPATITGLSSVTSTAFVGALTGNASTATALAYSFTTGQLLYGAGTGTPTSESGLLWDTSTRRLTLTSSTQFPAFVVTGTGGTNAYIVLNAGSSGTETRYNYHTPAAPTGNRRWRHGADSVGFWSLQQINDGDSATIRTPLGLGLTGNVIIANTTSLTDLGFGLQATKTGTNGTLLVFDPTATTGTSKALFVAGQGQGTSNLTEWRAYNATPGSGTLASGVNQTGDFFIGSGFTSSMSSAGFSIGTGKAYYFSSSTNSFGTADLSLSRSAANTLQVGDGGANANGTLVARNLTASAQVNVLNSTSFNTAMAVSNGADFANSQHIFRAYYDAASPTQFILGSYKVTGAVRLPLNLNDGGRVSIGGIIPSYNLDITGGSGATFRVFDQTATTGTTLAVIQAGQGQSGNLMEWRNYAGSATSAVDNVGQMFSASFITNSGTSALVTAQNTLKIYNAGQIVWSSTSGYSGTPDTAITRNAAGVLEINNGTAGTFRDLRARVVITTQSTPAASSDACTAGALWADATYIYACTASGTIKRATLASF